MAGHCSPVKLPESTGHPDSSRGQVSERSEAESKRWERSALSASEEVLLGCDRVLLERISPNKAKTPPGTQAPLLFSAVFEEIHSESTSSLRSGRFGRGLPQDNYSLRMTMIPALGDKSELHRPMM